MRECLMRPEYPQQFFLLGRRIYPVTAGLTLARKRPSSSVLDSEVHISSNEQYHAQACSICKSIMSEESNRSIEDQQPTVSGVVSSCLQEFKLCLDTAAALGPEELSLIEDQLARFSVWTANMAVFVPGRASMDHCLRQAPEVLDIVIGVLDALRSCIDTTK